MKVLFFGGDDFCIPTLESLNDGSHKVVGVVGKPEKPSGRGLKVVPSQLTEKASSLSIPYWQLEALDLNSVPSDFLETEWDIGVVAGYGALIPAWLLEKAEEGMICLHPSLLPRFRGAAPIERALMSGASVTGVTTFKMDEGFDTGDILLHSEVEINGYDTTGTLKERLGRSGAELVLETLEGIEFSSVRPRPQDEEIASYAPPLIKQEARIDWGQPAEQIDRLVRALNPEPIAYTFFRGKRARIHETRITDIPPEEEPGTIMEMGKEGLFVNTGTDCIQVVKLQMEGKNKMNATEFLRGQRLQITERFTDSP